MTFERDMEERARRLTSARLRREVVIYTGGRWRAVCAGELARRVRARDLTI